MQDLFVDKLGPIHISHGVVRIDLMRLESIVQESKQINYSPAVRLVMPVNEFMQAVQQLHQLAEQLAKKPDGNHEIAH